MAKFFGKKNEEANQDAAVSSIPVPPADSALVIDLPEGQKLVLGKMEEGTVIEVATWRGTGRPDSRTNRLMLGVSFGGTNPQETPKSEEQQIASLSGYEKYLFILKSLFSKIILNLRSRALSLKPMIANLRSKARKPKAIESYSSIKSFDEQSEGSEDFDIDKWLDSIRSKSRVAQLEQSAEGGKTKTPKKPSKSKAKSSSAGKKGKKGRK